MKVLAIADPYISADDLADGLSELDSHEITVMSWDVGTVEELQEINLAIEKEGPHGVPLPDDLHEAARTAEILIVQFAPIGAELIKECPDLKVIGVMRGGTENVDADAADAAGITVINAPGRNARAVAEFTVGMILGETRNIARTHKAMKDGVWLKEFPNSDYIPEIEDRTIAVIGAGAIGQLVMKFLSGMDARCLFYDPHVESSEYGERVESLEELVGMADVVTIHSRLSSETRHLIDRDILASMKPSAVIVNTARSGLIDEKALLDALESRAIAGAAIDTFDDEPLPHDSRWLTLDNVTLTSHLAGTTKDAFLKSPRIVARRIIDHLEKE